jgi:hypothetical protein
LEGNGASDQAVAAQADGHALAYQQQLGVQQLPVGAVMTVQIAFEGLLVAQGFGCALGLIALPADAACQLP